MNILFFIGSYYPSQQGGPCNSAHALAKGLLKAGVTIRVITTNYDIPENLGIPFNRWVEIEGIPVYYLRFPPETSPTMINLYLLVRPQRLLKLLGETTCSLVHTKMLFTAGSHHVADYARRRGTPVIWSPHGSMMSDAFRRSQMKKRLFLLLPFVKRSLRGCHFHATSEKEASEIIRWVKWYTGEDVGEKVTFIPHILGDEVFAPGADQSPYPFRYVLSLGRVHPIKKLENLIEAFAKLAPHSAPLLRGEETLRLVIAGWTGEVPEYTKMLKRLVEKLNLGERVVFTEKRVEGRDKATLYRHAEVFVLSSETENFGMVVLESLAQGTPVIASNKTPWEVLEKRGAGYWPANDPVSLAQVLEKFFAQSENERKNMREKALALAQEYHDGVLIDKYVYMYEQVLKENQHS